MKRFAALYRELDATTKTNEKRSAMVDYFRQAPAADAAWAVYFLSGRKLRRIVSGPRLRSWAAEQASIPSWLFEESYQWVGDLAETLAGVVPCQVESTAGSLTEWVIELQELGKLDANEQLDRLTELWSRIGREERFIAMKMITGSLRVGVSQRLLIRALADHTGVAADIIAHRLMGDWEPTADFYERLVDQTASDTDLSRPYPFALANPLEQEPHELGDIDRFLIEWKWDGIRAQLIHRQGKTHLWSRGEERLDGKYPEIESAAARLPISCVLDGEVLGWKDGVPLPFGELQRRIGRKQVGKKLLQEVPVIFLVFDLLEADGQDLRSFDQATRRKRLEDLFESMNGSSGSSGSSDNRSSSLAISLSPRVIAENWQAVGKLREVSRERKAEGLMLKHLESPYPVGRVRGPWWKWKVTPYSIDAVLIYAQHGHGRRAALFTDYTFGLWEAGELVPFAKAYSGLNDAEIRQVDRFIRSHTLEKFGPVHRVTPELVMELAFENIQLSNRHKCGLAVRFPRILRWRHDKRPEDANQLDDLKQMVLHNS